MTVIVASLFLPYTVQFEVNPLDEQFLSSKESQSTSVKQGAPRHDSFSHIAGGSAPIGITSSIIPSLTAANSANGTPQSSSPNNENNDLSTKNSSVEDFFYHHHKLKKPSGSALNLLPITPISEHLESKLSTSSGSNLTSGLNASGTSSVSTFIQPRSRYSSPPLQPSVVDKKKVDDDIGLPSLKINRSSGNLVSLNSTLSLTSTTGTSSVYAPKQRTGLSKLFSSYQDFSSESLVIDDDDDGGRYESSTKLAPFGGFSRPNIESTLLSNENIFETAPWTVVEYRKGNGSLVNAVRLATRDNIIIDRKWVGTLAMPSDAVPESIRADIAKTLSEEYNSETVFVSDITFQGHYKSFCKQILWPTLHYQIPDDPKSKAFEDHSWEHYKLLNQLIANKVIEEYSGDDDIIWVHDYHLLLVPKMIREKLPNAKIGFFLHVSFPSSEVFRCFAQRKALLEGILGANCISFQTDEYVRHFLQTCNRLLLADVSSNGLVYNGNITNVNTIPVGIDASSIRDLLNDPEVTEWRSLIRERWKDQKLVVSRDKLDRIRGVKHKLLAYESFLKSNPQFIESTILIQVCLHSSEDSDFVNEIMSIVTRINALAINISVFQPVVFLQQDIDFYQYLALMCEADVFTVSTTREGLNLTCHEFIVATNENKSPLILSEFTGSASLLGKSALLINPWDTKHFAETFKVALTMSPKEKINRWRDAYEIVDKHDSKHWVSKCLTSIMNSWEEMKKNTSFSPLTADVFRKVYYNNNNNDGSNGKRVFFLNFETPSACEVNPVGSKLLTIEPQRLNSLLNDLNADPRNVVYILSYFRRSDLDIIYRRTQNVGLIAENGGYIKFAGSNNWISIVNEKMMGWMKSVIKVMESKSETLPGTYIEIEDCTVRFHAEKAFIDDLERARSVVGECITHVNDLFSKEKIHATLIKDVIVVQQQDLTLKAVKTVLSYIQKGRVELEYTKLPSSSPNTPIGQPNELYPSVKQTKIDALFFCGGSTSIDEPAYEYAYELEKKKQIGDVLTIAIGPTSRTYAKINANGINEVVSLFSSNLKF